MLQTPFSLLLKKRRKESFPGTPTVKILRPLPLKTTPIPTLRIDIRLPRNSSKNKGIALGAGSSKLQRRLERVFGMLNPAVLRRV
jgi:hypothetical protein